MTEFESAGQPLVLLVDDDWLNRDLMRALLKRAGFRCAEATTGARALELAASHPPDLILLDVRLDDMSGFDVCTRIKGDAQTRAIPVILLTALEPSDEELQRHAAQADAFVSKSEGWGAVLEMIRRWFPVDAP